MDVSSSSIYWPFLGKPRLTDLCQMMHHPNYTTATSWNTQNTNWHIYKVLIRENSQQFVFQTLSNRHFENTLPQHDLVIYSWYWQLQNVITNLMDGAFMTVRCSSPSRLHVYTHLFSWEQWGLASASLSASESSSGSGTTQPQDYPEILWSSG